MWEQTGRESKGPLSLVRIYNAWLEGRGIGTICIPSNIKTNPHNIGHILGRFCSSLFSKKIREDCKSYGKLRNISIRIENRKKKFIKVEKNSKKNQEKFKIQTFQKNLANFEKNLKSLGGKKMTLYTFQPHSFPFSTFLSLSLPSMIANQTYCSTPTEL